ncbi:MAG: aspartate kinase [Bdellovibrionales bacterium]|nr:aspartate kinase [Bdellovibrionales bacterium]
MTSENRITALGRGGSDLTAVALSVGLNQDMCEIYTDVDGVLTGDPRLIPSARKISQLEFSEMMEMAALGSQVLQPRSVELGAKHQIKIHVRHSLKKGEGTWIMNLEDKMEKSVVSAIAHDPNTIVIRISNIPEEEGFLAHLFSQLGEESISVDIISKTETVQGPSLAFSINHEDVQPALKALKKFVNEKQILVVKNVAKISIIGVGMAHHSGVAGRFFSVFHKLSVPLHLITTSEIKISAIIDKKHLKKTANQLHKEFELTQNESPKQ